MWNGEAACFNAVGTLYLVPRKDRRRGPGFHIQFGTNWLSSAYAVSADGAVVAGSTTTPTGLQAFRWTQATGRVGLGNMTGSKKQDQSEARGLSSDGNVVVGVYGNPRALGGLTDLKMLEAIRAFRWSKEGGMKELPAAADNKGFLPLAALAVSADGNTVVGFGKYEGAPLPARIPFRWTEASGAVPLGDLAGGSGDSQAEAVAADGSVVVGRSAGQGNNRRAFVWEAGSGMHDLQAVLVRDYGLDLAGWNLQGAHGVSADCRTLVGSAFKEGELVRNQADAWRTWIITLKPSGKQLFAGAAAAPRGVPRKGH
jgi:probable HAF family extracellular repeat protein